MDDLLLSTYAEVREQANLVLVVGGGIGTPERGADYITGEWSAEYGRPLMPVDGVLIGTAVMTAKEAHTSPEVKQMLVNTPGIPAKGADVDPFAPLGEQWVPSGQARGWSHLRPEPPACRYLRAGKLFRALRTPAGARDEASGRAGKPP